MAPRSCTEWAMETKLYQGMSNFQQWATKDY